jgi:hypothetical protein
MEKVLMESMISQEMYGSGWRIGTMPTTTKKVLIATPKGRNGEKAKCCGADPGSTIQSICGPRTGSPTHRRFG